VLPDEQGQHPMRYSADMNQSGEVKQERNRIGLYFDCRYTRPIKSARGSTFYRCKRSDSDPNFPKYPRLPVLQCAGYVARAKC
jgi:hypothetical protein